MVRYSEELTGVRKVRYFVSIADSGSINAAAGLLQVAQSAISRQMLRLEDEGVLLQRSVVGVELTERGHFLLERARFRPTGWRFAVW
ncbi:LysR family transcriptional regulator [Bradyrhizobium sp. B097]|uniref:LysR family transcriptional regulator n=1 Tax=Bradyrhizobium sp. B097 TaxID=3140244 RepID=UPI0031834D9F